MSRESFHLLAEIRMFSARNEVISNPCRWHALTCKGHPIRIVRPIQLQKPRSAVDCPIFGSRESRRLNNRRQIEIGTVEVLRRYCEVQTQRVRDRLLEDWLIGWRSVAFQEPDFLIVGVISG